MNKKFNIFILFSALVMSLLTIVSCGNYEQAKYIVINELMANNRTGLQNDDNNPGDWIEIKNTGTEPMNLKGFTLVVTKEASKDEAKKVDDKNKDNEESEDNEEKGKTKEWSFPSVDLGAGECLVVFADKNKESESGKALYANLKFPKNGATVQLLAPNDKVVSEVKYDEIEPDQALALQQDSVYIATFWQSPGFDNDRQGYEAATQKIDAQRQGPLVIWELMSRAAHSYENWVELKNIGNKPIDISSYRLSKKMGKDEGWKLPAKTLSPGEVVSIQLVGSKAEPNTLQAPFKLGDNETVVLSKDGKFVDGLCAKNTQYGGSIGRQKGSKGFFFFSTPTPNEENGTGGRRYIAEKPEWNQKPGIYKKQKQVTLKLKNPGRIVHYTLDGSEPTIDSPVLKDSILLTKPTVVRSFAEGDSSTMHSNVATATYLIGVDHDLPVINISINNDDMFDYSKGIYAKGPGYGGEFPYYGANFWKKWTKKAHMELFDDKGGFASDCGLKIFGGYSRALDKKSLRIKFRGEFGDAKVKYDFFDLGEPMEFEDLVLRCGSQDYKRYMIKDEFFTSLAETGSPSLLIQKYRPVAVYVNAEYFGLFYLREKVDKNFVARKLHLSNDSIDVVASRPSDYTKVVHKISNSDITKKENYEYAKQNIDLQGLIDYKIGNIYSGKWDAGNIRYARSRHPKSDKKWHFVFYDIDASWAPDGKPGANFSLSVSEDVVEPNISRHNVLINSLLKNKEFRQLFLERLSYHLANTYASKNVTAHFDKFIAKIRKEMKYNCERWPILGYDEWEKNIVEFRSRIENRPKMILNDLRNYLSITDEENKKYFAKLGY